MKNLASAILFVSALLAVSSAPLSASIGACPVFPADNIWNARVDALPVHSRSAAYVNAIGAATSIHPDFGSGTWDGGPIGIPYTTVPGTQPGVAVSFYYPGESDPGPYPIPPDAPVEYGSDHHVLVADRDHCVLYELFDAARQVDGSWTAGSGAVFALNSNALRHADHTSADAAGLPILPGLVRYDEVAAGALHHALRFTVPATNGTSVWPARHRTASPFNSNAPAMGQRFRLKASFNTASFSHDTQVILTALKQYGMFVADNGSGWYISGAPDDRWNDDALVNELRQVHGSDLEAVDESGLMLNADSAQVRIAQFIPWVFLPFLKR